MAKLTTDLEKPAQSIKPREIAARSEGAARNALATALIVLGVIVCLFLVWETSANLLVMHVLGRSVQFCPSIVCGD
jgi:hypothetical protein